MVKKIICIVGVLDNITSTNVSMGYYLARLGYDILPVNYRTLIVQQGMDFFENHMKYICEKVKPFLIIFSKCNGISPKIVEMCTKYTKTWVFHMDPLKTLSQCPETLEHIKYSTYSSFTALDMVNKAKKAGIKNCYHIIQGTDPFLFKPVEPEEKYKADISFIGFKTPERDEFLKYLSNSNLIVKPYGEGYNPPVFNEEFSKVCSSSKFMLSMNTYNNEHKEYFSNRLVRYLSCGACVLHYDTTGTLNKYFKDTEDIIYFTSKEDLGIKYNTYICSEKARANIALSGREKVLKYFTWDKILNYMINLTED